MSTFRRNNRRLVPTYIQTTALPAYALPFPGAPVQRKAGQQALSLGQQPLFPGDGLRVALASSDRPRVGPFPDTKLLAIPHEPPKRRFLRGQPLLKPFPLGSRTETGPQQPALRDILMISLTTVLLRTKRRSPPQIQDLSCPQRITSAPQQPWG